MRGSVDYYAYCQGRASLNLELGTLSIPHPELGQIEVANVEFDARNISHVPVQSQNILEETYQGRRVILKLCSNTLCAVSDYQSLKSLLSLSNVPRAVGVHISYGEAFMVMEAIPTTCSWVTLQDLMNKEAWSNVSVAQWQSIICSLWQSLDAIHALGYIRSSYRWYAVLPSIHLKMCNCRP